MKIKLNQLTLVPPFGDKNHSLQFWSNDHAKVLEFKQNCMEVFNLNSIRHKLRAFLQGDAAEWFMFEFWTDNLELIMEQCEKAAERCGVELVKG